MDIPESNNLRKISLLLFRSVKAGLKNQQHFLPQRFRASYFSNKAGIKVHLFTRIIMDSSENV